MLYTLHVCVPLACTAMPLTAPLANAPPVLPVYRRYQDYQKGDIPVVPLDAAGASSVRVMAGSHAGVAGPIKMRNPGLLMDVRLAANGTFKQEVGAAGPGLAGRGGTGSCIVVVHLSVLRNGLPQPGL